MTRHELRGLDEIRRADRTRSEAKMRHGDRAGFLRVVNEVALRETAGATDDLARILVRADGAVRADAVEHGPEDVVGFDGERRVVVDAEVRDVVDDAGREVAARPFTLKLVEHAFRHRRRELFRREPETAADD